MHSKAKFSAEDVSAAQAARIRQVFYACALSSSLLRKPIRRICLTDLADVRSGKWKFTYRFRSRSNPNQQIREDSCRKADSTLQRRLCRNLMGMQSRRSPQNAGSNLRQREQAVTNW